MARHKKLLCVGPGGKRCVCCFPAPGSKARRIMFRAAKRKDTRLSLKEAKS